MKTKRQTDAQRFACKFFRCALRGLDGQVFKSGRRNWEDALRYEAGRPEVQGDMGRYEFDDKSTVIVAGEGWDFGITGAPCFCWADANGGRHDQHCQEHSWSEEIAERLSAIPDCRAKALDDGCVAIYDANKGWCAVDVDDAEDLADRLEDCESTGDTYSLWCSETDYEVVEVE